MTTTTDAAVPPTEPADPARRFALIQHYVEEIEREAAGIGFLVMVIRNPTEGDYPRDLLADVREHAANIASFAERATNLLPALDREAVTEDDREGN